MRAKPEDISSSDDTENKLETSQGGGMSLLQRIKKNSTLAMTNSHNHSIPDEPKIATESAE